MAHELDMTNNRANMAYVGDKPWHGLGQELTYNAPIETWEKEAGMDWNIDVASVEFTNFEGETKRFKNRYALYRSDNDEGLGIVSPNYKVVQPKQALEFFRDLISEKEYQLETAGCLFGGRKFWALAKAGQEFKIHGQDAIAPYLLMASSCDGSSATSVHLTSVRVVCNNTLRLSIGENGANALIRVPHSAIFDATSVKEQLGVVEETWDNFVDNVDRLARLKIDRDWAIDVVAQELKDDWKDKNGEELVGNEKLDSSTALKRIFQLYDGESLGNDFRSSKGTAWGLVNAVTQYYDHESGSKNDDKSRAFERAHLTDNASLKVKITNRFLEAA